MTFRIDPKRWDAMPGYRLKDEFDEFILWFGFNVSFMSEQDAAAGWQLVKELKKKLEERGLDTTEYMHIDSAARGDAQISLFPAHL